MEYKYIEYRNDDGVKNFDTINDYEALIFAYIKEGWKVNHSDFGIAENLTHAFCILSK